MNNTLFSMIFAVSAGIFSAALIRKDITPEEFNRYDEACLKAASAMDETSVGLRSASVKCLNGATFEMNRFVRDDIQ